MNILQEADTIINGPRRNSYGPVEESFQRIASAWSLLLKRETTAREVALCMIALKLLREANQEARDNRVDICGYAALLDQLHSSTQCSAQDAIKTYKGAPSTTP